MIIFHPWIDRVGKNAIYSSYLSSFTTTTASSNAITARVVRTDDMTALVKEDYLLECGQHNNCLRSFVEEEEEQGKMEFTPRQQNDDESNGEHATVIFHQTDEKEEEEGPKKLNEEEHHLPSFNDTDISNDDIICVNCHALFRIHVDVTFQGEVDSSSSSLSSTATAFTAMDTHDDEEKNWFIMLRDVTTHDDDQLLVYVQMDRPMDLRCGSAVPSNGCGHSLQHGGRCNDNHHDHHHHNAYLKKCQSTVIIEVPYTSFSSSNGYNSTSSSSSSSSASQQHYHEMTNERIILVSLLREWNSSDSSKMITMTKKRRIVDQWMINILVPPIKGDNGGGSVVHSSIYSAKLRDVVKAKYNSIVSEELIIRELGSTSDDSSSTSMYEVIAACLVGALGGVTILAIAFKFLPKDDDDDKEEEDDEEEEQIMTTPGILALQHAIRDSNSIRRDHADEESSQQEQSPQYASSEGSRSRTEEELEIDSAREQSTPTNLSPLFDDEADVSDVASNQDDDEDVDGEVEEETIQEQVEQVEEAEEAHDEDKGGSVVEEQDKAAEEAHDEKEEIGEIEEDTIQEQAEEVEDARGEDETAPRMMDGNDDESVSCSVDQDEETPPTSNKRAPRMMDGSDDESVACSVDQDEETPPTCNKRSTAPRRDSFDDIDDIIQEQNGSTSISSPLFYSPKYQPDDTAPLPHSNTSSQDERVYDQVEHAGGDDSNREMSVEPAIMLLSNPAEANHPPIDYRAEWNEFGAFAPNCQVPNADDNEAVTTLAGIEESTKNGDEDDSTLSGVSKRLFASSKQPDDEAVKASSMLERRKDSTFDEESNKMDESMFFPNVNVQAEAITSPPNLHQQRNIQAKVIESPPKVHRATMAEASPTLNPANTPTASSDEFDESMFLPNVDVQASANGSPPVEPPAASHQTINLPPASPADRSFAANASVSSNKSPLVASPALKTVNTPPTAPMSSSKEDNSPASRASAASFAGPSIKKLPAERLDANEASTTDKAAPDNSGNVSRITAVQQDPSSPSPHGSHHDLSYVNRSLSVSSSPSMTSAPRKSKSPSITSEPRFSPGGWNRSDYGSNEEVQQRKRRSLPFVSREDTSREKENASINSRTPLSAKATLYSPSSTVAATVAEFAVPRTKHGLAWRAERPVPVPTGSAGQNKRLGGSPEHFQLRGASNEEDESNDEPIDFMNGADNSSQNDSHQNAGSSRSGKRSRSSKDSKKSASRKHKTKNVEKKLLATIKTSDKHKPPSGLSCLSQRLEEQVWEVKE
jgi:hypothetical protein